MSRTLRLLAALVASALFFAACGSDGLSAEEIAAVNAFASTLEPDDDDEFDLETTDEENQCVGKGALKEFGLERTIELAEDDLESLPEDDARAAYSIFTGCIDGFDAKFAAAISAGFTEDDSFPVSDEEATCVSTSIVDEMGGEELFTAALTTDDGGDPPQDFLDAFVNGLVDCTDLNQIFTDLLESEIGDAELAECIVGDVDEVLLGQIILSEDEAAFEELLGENAVACGIG